MTETLPQNKSLLSLIDRYQEIDRAIVEYDGLLTPEMENELAEIEIRYPEKIDSYAVVLKRLESDAEYYKAEAKAIQAKAKSCERIIESIKERLKYAMSRENKTELFGNKNKFVLANSKQKLVIDELKLDLAYMMQVTTTEPDRKRITDDLVMGVPIAGASLQETKSIRQYLNRGEN